MIYSNFINIEYEQEEAVTTATFSRSTRVDETNL